MLYCIPVGLCSVDVAGVPPVKVHAQEVGLAVDRSVKFTVPPTGIEVGVPTKLATTLVPLPQ